MRLHEALGIDLAKLDDVMIQVIQDDPDLKEDSIILQSMIHLIRAGGKRLRPMLTIVGARFGKEPQSQFVMELASMLEFIHVASLIHDDVIDNSDMRRNELALHMKTDVPTAIHIANYMMARVMEWAAAPCSDSKPYTETLSSIITELCLGEYQQLQTRFNVQLSMDQYLEKTKLKTAMLMATCLQAGSYAADADHGISDALYSFGECLGMAFQIRDDVLDFTSSSDELGKPAGCDLLQGNVTLPVLCALQIPGLAERIRVIGPDTPKEELQTLIQDIAQSEAIQQSLEIAAYYTAQAKKVIYPLRSHPAYADLQTLFHYFTPSETGQSTSYIRMPAIV